MSLAETIAALGGNDGEESDEKSGEDLGYADKYDHASRSSANDIRHRRHFKSILGPQIEPNDAASERLRISDGWIREHRPILRSRNRR